MISPPSAPALWGQTNINAAFKASTFKPFIKRRSAQRYDPKDEKLVFDFGVVYRKGGHNGNSGAAAD